MSPKGNLVENRLKQGNNRCVIDSADGILNCVKRAVDPTGPRGRSITHEFDKRSGSPENIGAAVSFWTCSSAAERGAPMRPTGACDWLLTVCGCTVGLWQGRGASSNLARTVSFHTGPYWFSTGCGQAASRAADGRQAALPSDQGINCQSVPQGGLAVGAPNDADSGRAQKVRLLARDKNGMVETDWYPVRPCCTATGPGRNAPDARKTSFKALPDAGSTPAGSNLPCGVEGHTGLVLHVWQKPFGKSLAVSCRSTLPAAAQGNRKLASPAREAFNLQMNLLTGERQGKQSAGTAPLSFSSRPVVNVTAAGLCFESSGLLRVPRDGRQLQPDCFSRAPFFASGAHDLVAQLAEHPDAGLPRPVTGKVAGSIPAEVLPPLKAGPNGLRQTSWKWKWQKLPFPFANPSLPSPARLSTIERAQGPRARARRLCQQGVSPSCSL